MKNLELSDGRDLAYDDYGDPDGTPVIFNHGLSDSALIRNPDDALTASLGDSVPDAGPGHQDHARSPVAQDDESDRDTFLRDRRSAAMFAASFTAGKIQGGEGIYEMTMALWDWGFRPEDISHHVDLFSGDADDMLDPKMPLHLAERLPDCTTHVWPGAGHSGFVDRGRWTELFQAAA